jgi:hypothetical protein
MYVRRLIYLSAHQITAFSWQAGVLSDEGSFEATEAGKQRFANYLAQTRRASSRFSPTSPTKVSISR